MSATDVRLPALDSPAHDRLGVALLNAVGRNQFVPCSGWGADSPWLSDSADDRCWAADRCRHCPVIEECAEAGASESFGVWGAIDQATRRGQK